VSRAVTPDASEADPGQLLQTLWMDPVPSFLTSALESHLPSSGSYGLVPVDPPRALGVPAIRNDDRLQTASRGGIPIKVFFPRHPESEAAFSVVFPVTRVAPAQAVATAALAGLIEGPNAPERAAGYFSELGSALTGPSACAGRDFRIAITSGTATVRFCRAVTSVGVSQNARIRSQIETTLRQFPTVQAVRLLARSGHCLFDDSGQDRCLPASGATPPPSAGQGGTR